MGRPRALNGTTGASSLRRRREQLYYSGSRMMIVRVIRNCGIISRKTNYKGQVILPFIFFYLS